MTTDIIADTDGNYFAGCCAGYNPTVTDLYVQKFRNDGTLLWGSYGAPLCVGQAGSQGPIEAVSDGMGGIICIWNDYRHSDLYPMLFIQHLDADGRPLLPVNGMPLRHAGGERVHGHVWDAVPDGEGGGVWSFEDPASVSQFYLIRVNGQGRTLWEWTNDREHQRSFEQMLLHPADCTIWLSNQEMRTPSNWGCYVYRLDLMGHSLFSPNGLPIGGIMAPTTDGVITVRSADDHGTKIMARRIDAVGGVVWANAIALYEYSPGHDGYWPDAIAPDGSDGAVISMLDNRNWMPATRSDLVAQRVQWNGQLGNPQTPTESHHSQIAGIIDNTVAYYLPTPGIVRIEIFDIQGRKVSTLFDDLQSTGHHEARFDNRTLASGVYLLKLTTPLETRVLKLPVVR